MRKLIKTFTAGSCGIHDAPFTLSPLGFSGYLFGRLGFSCAPYALSSGAVVQLFDFCAGELQLPEAVRMLAYMDKNQPTQARAGAVLESDIAFVELSTPIEPMLGDYIVNFNRIEDFVVKPLRQAGVDRRTLSDWSKALVGVSSDLPERAAALLKVWPENVEGDDLARIGVENLSARRLDVDQMVEDLQGLRKRLNVPMVLKLYDFKYMPDGRPIDWPAGFKDQQIEVARRLNAPTLDLAPVVAKLGADRLIGEDMAHWRRNTLGMQAELMYDFWAEVLDRPYLEAFSEWRRARPSFYETLPEFLHQPARLSFPNLGFIPMQGIRSRRGKDDRDGTTPRSTQTARNKHIPGHEVADALNDALVNFYRARSETMGVQPSGLYSHYQAVVDAGRLVGERERVAMDIVESQMAAYANYAVIRGGLGELAFLLAATGRKVTACEPNPFRRGAIEAARTHLEDLGLLKPNTLKLHADLMPDASSKGRLCGIGLDATYVKDDAAGSVFMERTPVFDAMLIDPRLFIKLRNSVDEQEELIAALQYLGFVRSKRFHHEGMMWLAKSATVK